MIENYNLIINKISEEDCDFDKDILLSPLQKHIKKQLKRIEEKKRAKEATVTAQINAARNPQANTNSQANADSVVNARGNSQAYFYSNPRSNGKKIVML